MLQGGAMSDQPMIEIWGAGTMRTLRPLWVLEELGLPYHLCLLYTSDAADD